MQRGNSDSTRGKELATTMEDPQYLTEWVQPEYPKEEVIEKIISNNIGENFAETSPRVWKGEVLEAVAEIKDRHEATKEIEKSLLGLYQAKWSFLLLCDASVWIQNSNISAWMLMAGGVTSQLGLWMFDLSVTQQVQDQVPDSDRCFVGVQNSLQYYSISYCTLWEQSSQDRRILGGFFYGYMVFLGDYGVGYPSFSYLAKYFCKTGRTPKSIDAGEELIREKVKVWWPHDKK
ncbi:hypothetical protein C5167_026010 [Papaver somniferum]|nr:hypothetical protein C5167_026010 [Papaver somniferum]